MWEAERKLTPQETRAGLPDVPRHRARKDRRRWCGGHVGREHVRVTRMSKWGQWRITQGSGTQCGWRRHWRWLRVGEPIPPDAQVRRHGQYVVPSAWYWSCSHEIGCTQCGKILDSLVEKACPDYHERPAG